MDVYKNPNSHGFSIPGQTYAAFYDKINDFNQRCFYQQQLQRNLHPTVPDAVNDDASMRDVAPEIPADDNQFRSCRDENEDYKQNIPSSPTYNPFNTVPPNIASAHFSETVDIDTFDSTGHSLSNQFRRPLKRSSTMLADGEPLAKCSFSIAKEGSVNLHSIMKNAIPINQQQGIRIINYGAAYQSEELATFQKFRRGMAFGQISFSNGSFPSNINYKVIQDSTGQYFYVAAFHVNWRDLVQCMHVSSGTNFHEYNVNKFSGKAMVNISVNSERMFELYLVDSENSYRVPLTSNFIIQHMTDKARSLMVLIVPKTTQERFVNRIEFVIKFDGVRVDGTRVSQVDIDVVKDISFDLRHLDFSYLYESIDEVLDRVGIEAQDEDA